MSMVNIRLLIEMTDLIHMDKSPDLPHRIKTDIDCCLMGIRFMEHGFFKENKIRVGAFSVTDN